MFSFLKRLENWGDFFLYLTGWYIWGVIPDTRFHCFLTVVKVKGYGDVI